MQLVRFHSPIIPYASLIWPYLTAEVAETAEKIRTSPSAFSAVRLGNTMESRPDSTTTSLQSLDGQARNARNELPAALLPVSHQSTEEAADPIGCPPHSSHSHPGAEQPLFPCRPVLQQDPERRMMRPGDASPPSTSISRRAPLSQTHLAFTAHLSLKLSCSPLNLAPDPQRVPAPYLSDLLNGVTTLDEF